jgi:hypothetical protein
VGDFMGGTINTNLPREINEAKGNQKKISEQTKIL